MKLKTLLEDYLHTGYPGKTHATRHNQCCLIFCAGKNRILLVSTGLAQSLQISYFLLNVHFYILGEKERKYPVLTL